jgi:hypothetical protein
VPYFSVAASSAAADDDEARNPPKLYNLVLGTTPTLLETDPIRDPPPTSRPRDEIPLIIFMISKLLLLHHKKGFKLFFSFLPVHTLSLSLSLPRCNNKTLDPPPPLISQSLPFL